MDEAEARARALAEAEAEFEFGGGDVAPSGQIADYQNSLQADPFFSSREDLARQRGELNSPEFSNKLRSSALEAGLSMAVPQTKIPAAAGLIGKGARYLLNSGAQAIGLEAGSDIAQMQGLQPEKTNAETGESLLKNTGLGVAIPAAMDTGAAFLKSIFTGSRALASRLGSVEGELNPDAKNYLIPKLEELQSNSSFFNDNVVKVFSPKKRYDNVVAYQDQIGGQIGGFYQQYPNVQVNSADIIGSPEVRQLVADTQKLLAVPQLQKEANKALGQLNNIWNTPSSNLADVWELRKDLDSLLQASLYSKNTGNIANYAENLKSVADGVRGSIENTIAREVNLGNIPADVAEALLKNKQEYGNLDPFKKVLGRNVGQDTSDSIITKLRDQFTGLTPTSIAAGLAVVPGAGPLSAGVALTGALASDTGQTLAANGISALEKLAPMASKYFGVGSAILSKSSDVNVKQLQSSLWNKALSVVGPEQAQALTEQTGQILKTGSPIIKEQWIATLAQQFPDLFEPPKDGLGTIVDNRIQDPLEADLHLKAGARLANPEDRARVIGGLYDGKRYEPLATNQAAQPQQAPIAPKDIDLSAFSQGLTYDLNKSDYSYDGEQESVLSQFEKMTQIHSQDF